MVYYEIPGQISLSKLRENGLDMDSLCRHYVYITEFLWNVSGLGVQTSARDMLCTRQQYNRMDEVPRRECLQHLRWTGQVSGLLGVVVRYCCDASRRLSLR